MNSSKKGFSSESSGKKGISMPDMAPFAGVIFCVVFFYMSTSSFKGPETGIVPLEQLVEHTPVTCTSGIHEGNEVIISINERNQTSFAPTGFDKETQAEIFKRVAYLHHITLTKSETNTLETLPFLAVDIRELPAFLNLPPSARQQQIQKGAHRSIDSLQLTEYIQTSRKMARENHKYGPFIHLKIASGVKMPQVERLIDLVSAQGINRFVLLTQSNHIDYPLGLEKYRTQQFSEPAP